MKQWNFYDKVYRRWVVVMIGPFKELIEELESCGYKDLDDIVNGNGMCIELNDDNNTTNQRCLMLWMKSYGLGCLVHELIHLIMMAFSEVEVPISRHNTEAFAYYMEFWYKEITEAKRKYPEGIKPKDVIQ